MTTAATYPSSDAFLAELCRQGADQLWKSGDGRLFLATSSDRLIDVFRGLVRHGFSSVPVIAKRGHEHAGTKFDGFLDMADLVGYILTLYGRARLSGEVDLWKLLDNDDDFKQKTVADVMLVKHAARNPFRSLPVGFSLFSAVELLARVRGLHRIAIVEEDHRLHSIVTQSEVVALVHKHIEKLGAKANMPVKLMPNAICTVVSLSTEARAIEAFRVMIDRVITGIAICDDSTGAFLGAISLRDLKSVGTDGRLFWRLFQSCGEFMASFDGAAPGGRQTRVTVLATETLSDVFRKLVDHKVHRVFVIDPTSGAPTGVVTCTDALRALLE